MPTGFGRLSSQSRIASRCVHQRTRGSLRGGRLKILRSDDVGTPQYAFEVLLPPDRPVVERVAEEGEVLQAAVPEVVEGKARDRLVVGLDPGDALDQAGGAHVDCRHVHRRDDPRHPIGFDSRDGPVELPVAGERLVDLVATVLGEVEGPAAAIPGIFVNPTQDAPGIAIGSFDDDRDVPLVLHRPSPRIARRWIRHETAAHRARIIHESSGHRSASIVP